MSILRHFAARIRWLSADCHRRRTLRLSAPVYFACVALATLLGVAVTMLLRPAFAHSVLRAVGLEKEVHATPRSFYAVRVAPLFDSHCESCHGPKRQKGKLRLDTFAAAMRGGRRGPVIKAGNVEESEVIARITLPPANDKAMPPEGKPGLKADEITVIELWIAAGASGVLPVEAIKGAPPPVVPVRFSDIDEAAVARERAALALAVEQLQLRFPGLIAYVSRGSADMEVNASLAGDSFGDAQLAALATLRDRIVRADFSRTAIGDGAIATLVGMRRLRTLRLMDTNVTDATIMALVGLKELQSLTVVGTAVSEDSLALLRDKGVTIYANP